ncbi:MAG TPA: hypothetical protein VKE51_39765 [Vicinamibacterales bacterium]|nr:hypothetical protein [Vicinamibacterales bacterium]
MTSMFVLVILAHERRRVVHVAVTDHPMAAWTAERCTLTFCTFKGELSSLRRIV